MIMIEKDPIVKYLNNKINDNNVLEEDIAMELYLNYTLTDIKKFKNYITNEYVKHSLTLKNISKKNDGLNYQYEIKIHKLYQDIMLDILNIYNELEEKQRLINIRTMILKSI